MSDIESLIAAEQRLQAAQLSSDVDELDRLLHPDLLFVTPDGEIHVKDDDLDSHRSGAMRVDSLEPEDLVARTWAPTDEGWRLVAASIMALA